MTQGRFAGWTASREVDDVREQARFDRGHGVDTSDAEALGDRLREVLEEHEQCAEDAKKAAALNVRRDCGALEMWRIPLVWPPRCASRKEDEEHEDCVACRMSNRVERSCDLSDDDRAYGVDCDSEGADPCHLCAAATLTRALDCGLSAAQRAQPDEFGCKCPGAEEFCAECRIVNARRNASEVSAEQAADARVTALEAELARARLRLDCGLEFGLRGGPSLSRCLLARDDGPGDVCAECMIVGIGRSVDREKRARIQAEDDRSGAAQGERDALARAEAAERELAAVRGERNLLVAAQGKPAAVRKAPPVTVQQAALDFGALTQAATVEPVAVPPAVVAKPLRACGCQPRGRHNRAICSLAKTTPSGQAFDPLAPGA